MNRQGKKSPPTTAKKIKANRSNSLVDRNRSSSRSNRKGVVAQKKASKFGSRKSFLSTLSNSRSGLKSDRLAKKTIALKSKVRTKNRRNSSTEKPKLQPKLLLLAIYATAIITGISTILGTTVSIASSFKTAPSKSEVTDNSQASNSDNKSKLQQLLNLSVLGREINPLKTKLEALAQQYPELEPEVFLVDMDTKDFVSIRGKERIASASTIKLPILVAFFQDLDRQTISLEEQLTMTEEHIAEGSGDMQYLEPGTKFSALETAEKTIVKSDNTATNMLIERLGGMEELNRRFMAMGLVDTQLSNLLPDLTGTNTTSPEDLGNLLLKINNGELISLRSRDRLLHIMSNVENDTLLPQGIESDALIAHKTGDIKSVLADVGTIDLPNGKRYIASMLVKRPDNSSQAREFIQQASSIAYQYFTTPQNEPSIAEEE